MRRQHTARGGWKVAIVLPVTVACVLSGMSAGANAQSSASSRDDAKRKLESGRERLTSAEQRAMRLQGDVSGLRAEQARINERLIEAGRLTQQSEIRMSRIEARLGELDAQEKLIRGSLAQRHGQMARLFAAMQRMGRNPPPVIVTRREDALKMVRSAMLLARAFPELRTQAESLSTRLNDLVRVMTEARQESARLKSETLKLNEAKTRLAALVESKRQTLADRQKELAEVRRAAAEISRNVSDLSELISRLDKEVASRTTLGEYEREQRELERKPREAAPAESALVAKDTEARPNDKVAMSKPTADNKERPSGAGTAVAAKVPGMVPGKGAAGDEASGAEPQIALLPRGPLTQNPGRMKPAIPFEKAKRQLPLPARGRQLIGFGDKTQFGSSSKGVVIETRTGATVVSPCDGWIVYAGPFRSYGQVLIINAGGGYHILLANLARIDVEVGRFVLAAEPVGTMETKFSRNSQDSAPVLYVEFRNKQGKSIDPSPWWAEASQKVQG